MSNRIILCSTTFTMAVYGIGHGYTICDDYDKDYWDLEEFPVLDEMKLLKLAKQHSPDMFVGQIAGIEINGTWYDNEVIFKETEE